MHAQHGNVCTVDGYSEYGEHKNDSNFEWVWVFNNAFYKSLTSARMTSAVCNCGCEFHDSDDH